MGTSLKNFAFSTILIVASTLLSFGAGEMFLRLKNANMQNYDIEMWRYARVIKRPSENRILGHEHVPSSAATLQSVEIRINSDGLRGDEVGPRRAGEERVLLIGSSIALGWGVPEEETLSRRLSRMLEDTGRSVSVLNAGIGNYNAERYVERFLIKLAPLEPSVVVIQYFLNDAEKLAAGGGNWFLRNSQLAVTLWTAFNRVFRRTGEGALIDHYNAVYEPSAEGYRAMLAAFEKLSAYAKEKGIDVVLAMTPDVHNLSDYPFGFIHDELKEISRKFGFIYVDLLPAFAGLDAEDLWAMPGDPHPNSQGHKLMAEALYPILEDAVGE